MSLAAQFKRWLAHRRWRRDIAGTRRLLEEAGMVGAVPMADSDVGILVYAVAGHLVNGGTINISHAPLRGWPPSETSTYGTKSPGTLTVVPLDWRGRVN